MMVRLIPLVYDFYIPKRGLLYPDNTVITLADWYYLFYFILPYIHYCAHMVDKVSPSFSRSCRGESRPCVPISSYQWSWTIFWQPKLLSCSDQRYTRKALSFPVGLDIV